MRGRDSADGELLFARLSPIEERGVSVDVALKGSGMTVFLIGVAGGRGSGKADIVVRSKINEALARSPLKHPHALNRLSKAVFMLIMTSTIDAVATMGDKTRFSESKLRSTCSTPVK